MDSEALLRWYRANRRELPWRGTTDAYHVLVSEVMLQQTQVATVIPYYERFLSRFPTATALAAAPEDEVLAHWAGLGYYRRARALRECAKHLSKQKPSTVSEWRALAGLGDYTAAAIASIVDGERIPCVDGNVRRVFARHYGLRQSGAPLDKTVASLSRTAMGRRRPGDWNQAVMELGATVCTARNPSCQRCPISATCFARANEVVDEFPTIATKPKTIKQLHVCVCPVYRGRAGVRRIERGWWHGLWEFPRTVTKSEMRGLQVLGFDSAHPLGTVRHTVTNNRIELRAYWAKSKAPMLQWLNQEELLRLPMPSPQKRVREMLLAEVLVP